MRSRLPKYCVALVAAVVSMGQAPRAQDANVTRATLDNGLRVVIVRDALAPVVTVEDNFLVGGDETPDGFPGMAHAQEHMSFRGCAGVSADQTAAIFAELGGVGNADTQQNVTQFYTTVPNADLEVALRLDAACMKEADDAASEWDEERGAIEQEVSRDLSDPIYKFQVRLNEDMFAGTPYAHDPLGTRPSFEATTGAMLKQFFTSWYVPNNAVLVVAGNVDAAKTLALIRTTYGSVPRRTLPARPAVNLGAVKSETFTVDSNLPYTLAFVSYRLPGSDSPDFAAAEILADVLGSQRANIYALVPAGKALDAGFGLFETFPKASVGFSEGVVPAGTDSGAIIASLRSIVAAYAANGLPPELVDAAKRSEISHAEFNRNSIPGLAGAWSQAIAAEGRQSPDDDVAAIRRVTVADVNRVARETLTDANSITATLVPAATQEAVASKGFGGAEQTTSAPSKRVTLPEWAASTLGTLTIPPAKIDWTDSTLPNGIRLIVETQKTSPTVTVLGHVRQEPGLQVLPGKEGVDDVLDGLFSYGTTSLDRLAFQKALDDIAASETAGADFSVRVLKANLSRGVELLADNELRPALPPEAFSTVKQQVADYLAGELKSPGYKADRALRMGLLPAHDPKLRDATPETVTPLTLADVKTFYDSTFRPDLTTIVVIGDVTPADARQTVAKWFGGWKAAGAKPDTTLPRVPVNTAASTFVPDPDQVQSSVVLAEEVGITRFDPDYYALQLGDHVLGGGFYATRLYHDLRQVAGLVYTVDDSLAATKSRTVYTVTYGCDPDKVDEARQLIARDLRSMQTDNVTDEELHQAKALLLRQIPLHESSEDSVAEAMLARAAIDLPLDEPQHAATRYSTMTADDVRAAFAKWIRPDGFVQVVTSQKQ